MAPPRHVFKIVVTGPFAAGKTTFIQTVVEREFLTTSARTSVVDESSVKHQTTIGMDFGALTLADPEGDVELRVYGTPGQERFRFMWEVLADGADGYVLVVSAEDEASWPGSLAHHEVMAGLGLPGVVAVNRATAATVGRAESFFAGLAVPVVPFEAVDRGQVREVLLSTLVEVLEHLEDSSDDPGPAGPPAPPGEPGALARPVHLTGLRGGTP